MIKPKTISQTPKGTQLSISNDVKVKPHSQLDEIRENTIIKNQLPQPYDPKKDSISTRKFMVTSEDFDSLIADLQKQYDGTKKVLKETSYETYVEVDSPQAKELKKQIEQLGKARDQLKAEEIEAAKTVADYDAEIEALQKQHDSIQVYNYVYDHRGSGPTQEGRDNKQAQKDDIKRRIDALKAKRELRAREENIKNKYGHLADSADFAVKSKEAKYANKDELKAANKDFYDPFGYVDGQWVNSENKHELAQKYGWDAMETSAREAFANARWQEEALLVYDSRKAARDYEYGEFLKEDEVAIFNYLFNTQGVRKAQEYLDDMKTILEKRYTDTQAANYAKIYNEASDFGKVMLNVATVPANLFGTITAGANDLYEWTGGSYSPYGSAHSLQNFTDTVRGKTEVDIIDAVKLAGGSDTVAKLAGTLYQGGMSGADAMLGGAALGSGYLAIAGANAATHKAKELYESGAEGWQIALGSVASGALEAAIEKLPLDNLLAMKNAGGADDLSAILKNILKQSGLEGSEEALTELANLAADCVLQGGNSDLSRQIAAYESEGHSSAEAQKMALRDKASDVLWATVAGMGSGGGSAAVFSTIGYGNMLSETANLGKSYLQKEGGLEEALGVGLDNARTTQAYKSAQMIAERAGAGKSVSAYQVGKMLHDSQTTDAQKARVLDYAVRQSAAAFDVSADVTDMVADIAAGTGRQIVFGDLSEFDGEIEKVGGQYDPETGVVTISPRATTEQVVNFLAKHEITHSIEGTQQWGQLADIVQAQLGDDKWSESISEVMERYAANGKELDLPHAEYEVVADWIGKNLYKSGFAQAIVNGDATVGNTFVRAIDKLRLALGNKKSRSHANLAVVERLFMRALENEVQTREGSVKYSLSGVKTPSREELIQKEPVTVVDISVPQTKGTFAERRRHILNDMEEIIDKPYLNKDTNALIFLTKESYKHAFNNIGDLQLNAAEHLPELIENAVLTHAEKITHGNSYATGIYTFFAAAKGKRIYPVKLKVKEYSYAGQELPKNIKKYFENQPQPYAASYDTVVLEVEEITESSPGSDKDINQKDFFLTPEELSKINVADLLDLVKGDSKKFIPEFSVFPVEGVAKRDVFGFFVDKDANVDEDLLEELATYHPEAKVDAKGNVTVYHRTTSENAAQIKRSGMMYAKEDAVFFSSKADGYATDYGDTVVKLKIPSTVLRLNDVFDGEVHFDVPAKYRNGRFVLDVSRYLVENNSSSGQLSFLPTEMTGTDKPDVYQEHGERKAYLAEEGRDTDGQSGTPAPTDARQWDGAIDENGELDEERLVQTTEENKITKREAAKREEIAQLREKLKRGEITDEEFDAAMARREIDGERQARKEAVADYQKGKRGSAEQKAATKKLLRDAEANLKEKYLYREEKLDQEHRDRKEALEERYRHREERHDQENRDRKTALEERYRYREEKLDQEYRDRRDRERQRRENQEWTRLKNKLRDNVAAMEHILLHPNEKNAIPTEMIEPFLDITTALEGLFDDKAKRINELQQRLREEESPAKRVALQKRIKNLRDHVDDTAAVMARLNTLYGDYMEGNHVSEAYKPIAKKVDDALRMVGTRTIDGLSVNEIEQLVSTIQMMMHTAAHANTLYGESYIQSVQETGEQLEREARENNILAKGWGKKLLTMQLDVNRFCATMGGFAKNSAWNTVGQEALDGQTRMLEINRAFHDHFAEIIDDKENPLKKLMSTKKDDLVDVGLVDIDGKPILVTRDIMLSIYQQLTCPANRQAIMDGGLEIPDMKRYYGGDEANAYSNGVRLSRLAYYKEIGETLEAIDRCKDDEAEYHLLVIRLTELEARAAAEYDRVVERIESLMTDKERKYCALAREWFDNISKDYINDVTMDVFGFRKAIVKQYYPIYRNTNFVATDFESLVQNATLENTGSLKERVRSRAPVKIAGITNVLMHSEQTTARYCGFLKFTMDINRLMNVHTKDMKHSVKDTLDHMANNSRIGLGVTPLEYIENLMADIANARKGESSLFSALRRNVIRATMTFNLRVAVKQIGAVFTSAGELGWKYQSKAVQKVGRKLDPAMVAKYSVYFHARYYGDSGMEEFAAMKQGTNVADRMYRKADELTKGKVFNWCQGMDNAVCKLQWFGCEAKIRDTRPDLKPDTEEFYQAVGKELDRVIQKTQTNYTLMERSDLSRDTRWTMKILSTYKTDAIQGFNMLFEANARYRRYKKDLAAGKGGVTQADVDTAKKQLADTIPAVLVGNVLWGAFAGILMNLLMQRTSGVRDDNNEITAASVGEALLSETLGGMAGLVVFGDQVYDIAASRIFGDNYYGISDMGIETLSGLLEDFATGNFTKGKTIKYLLQDMGKVVGIPLKNAWDMGEGIAKHIEDLSNGEFLSLNASADTTPTQYYRQLYKALQKGDAEKVSEIREFLITCGKTEAEIQTGLRAAVKKTDKDFEKKYQAAMQEAMEDMFYQAMTEKEQKRVASGISGYIADQIVAEKTGSELTKANQKAEGYIDKGASVAEYFVVNTAKNADFADKNHDDTVSKAEFRGVMSDAEYDEHLKRLLMGLK